MNPMVVFLPPNMCPQKDQKFPHALERRYIKAQGGCGLQIPEFSQSRTPGPGTKDSDGRCGYNTPESQMGPGFIDKHIRKRNQIGDQGHQI